ncbi:MAG: YceI family protein [Flavobacteriaceae bacterium]|nr:YceI family protein [Flavobacteriaceae bacterium]
MKTHKLFLALALTGFIATAQTTWKVDNVHSTVRFSIAHMVISEIEGNFTSFSGTITNEKADFSDAKINFTIDANSIYTRNKKRDGHLKSADFFDVVKYPSLTFKSTSLQKKDAKHFILTGYFTMHGVRKLVKLDLLAAGTIKDNNGNLKAGFKVTGTLKRSDFGLKYNSVMDNGGVVIGDEVSFSIKLETKQVK